MHVGGHMCDMESISKIAKDYNLVIIEDAAQAICGSLNGKKAGSWSKISAFSMNPMKILHAYGEAGVVTISKKQMYEKIKQLGYESEELYYNLGNAYFKSKQLGNAILHYEKALRLAPNNKDIQFNLKLVNSLTVDKIDMIPRIFFMQWWHDFSSIYSSKWWTYIFLALYVLVCFSIRIFYITYSPTFPFNIL